MLYSPFFPSGVSDFAYYMSPHHMQFRYTTLCAQLEMKFLDCIEAYGANRARAKCADLLYDMHECSTNHFQILRAQAIRKERMRQYRAGILAKPFDEYPPLDSYLYI